MAAGKGDPTPRLVRADWERELRRTAKRLTALRDLERYRARLFIEGRGLDPPVTFAEMAKLAGVTQAAVIQATKREEKRPT